MIYRLRLNSPKSGAPSRLWKQGGGRGALLWAGCTFLALWGCHAAPEVPQEDFAPAPPPRPYSSAEALRQFEAPSEEVYRLGEGDNLTIQIWDHVELSGAQVIGPDGRITLPVAGSLRVAGLTREDAAKIIKEALSKSFDGIVATVKVDQYVANRVVILGKVKTPGVYRFESQPTLLEALSRAGGAAVFSGAICS